jgi:hypothetical protein
MIMLGLFTIVESWLVGTITARCALQGSDSHSGHPQLGRGCCSR